MKTTWQAPTITTLCASETLGGANINRHKETAAPGTHGLGYGTKGPHRDLTINGGPVATAPDHGTSGGSFHHYGYANSTNLAKINHYMSAS